MQSIRNIAIIAHVDLDYKEFVIQDEKFYRPAEVELLISDPTKARTTLNWEPSVTFKELVTMMVDSDLARQLLEGPWDTAYWERRRSIGRTHVRVGLPERYMFTAMNLLRAELVDIARKNLHDERASVA